MSFRPPVPGDAPAVLALLEARDIADFGVSDCTLNDLRDDWNTSDFDLAADAVVVEADDGEIIGYAAILQPGAHAVVSPEFEGRGIGALVLDWTERRDHERGRERHRQWVAGGNDAARELLLAAGYRAVRSYWRMVRDLDDVADASAPPVGISLRPFDADTDSVTVHELNEASFADNADYHPEPYSVFREQHLQAHDFDPELSCVATHGELSVGFLLARRWVGESVGFVDVLAVHPEHRGRGLGRTMLALAFTRFAAAGLREAQLGVASDNPQARRLYERCGMSPRFRFDTYERRAR